MRKILNESKWGDLINKVESAKLNKGIEESLIELIYRYYNDGDKCGDIRTDPYGYATKYCDTLGELTDDKVFDIMYDPSKVRYEKKLQTLVDYICDTYGKNSIKESKYKVGDFKNTSNRQISISYVDEEDNPLWVGSPNELDDCDYLDYNVEEVGEEGKTLYLSIEESKKSARKSIKESLNFKKDYAVEVSGGDYWFKPFYWDFDEFRDDLLIASEESEFTYHITTASTTDYRIDIKFNNGPSTRYDIQFRIIPKSNKETLKELNDYLN